MAATKSTKASAKKSTAKSVKNVTKAAKSAKTAKKAATTTKVAKKATSTAKKAAPRAAVAKKHAAKTPTNSTTKAATTTSTQKAKAAAPAKKAASRKVDKKFLEVQLKSLEEDRATYTRQAASLRAEADLLAAEREPGDVQFDEESGEGDTLAVERERDLALSAQANAAVEEIDMAIAKISNGGYGVCDRCGKDIPRERLRALPYAALCVTCKSAGFTRR